MYRVPLRDRIGRGALITVFSLLAIAGPILLVIAPLFHGGVALAGLGLMVSVTAAVFLTIHWMANAPETSDVTIEALAGESGRASRCRVVSGRARWSLPVRGEDLHVGQRIRVTFRRVAPVEADDEGCEVVEVKALEE